MENPEKKLSEESIDEEAIENSEKKRKKGTLKKSLACCASILTIGGLSFLVYRTIEKKYSFLKEQGINIHLLPESTIQQFAKMESMQKFEERLDLALSEYNKGTNESIDIAGFLTFSTLENFLNDFLKLIKPKTTLKHKRGIVNLCKVLRSSHIISRDDYDSIATLVKEVRNNVIHGCSYVTAKVKDAIQFVRYFINKYIKIYGRFFNFAYTT